MNYENHMLSGIPDKYDLKSEPIDEVAIEIECSICGCFYEVDCSGSCELNIDKPKICNDCIIKN